MSRFKGITLARALPWLLIVCGGIGLICAFIISYEKIQILQDPSFVPECNLNPVISCGSVMKSPQAEAFGFPNPFIGLMAFPLVIATGAAMLAGAKLKRWWWLGLQAGTIFGLAIVHWLFFQSTYRINALCPYCIVVWIVTITTFWYVLLYNIQAKFIAVPARLRPTAEFIRRHHLDLLVLWFAIITFFILKHFWYYYGSFLN